MNLQILLNDKVSQDEVLALYRANQWSSAEKPDTLLAALHNSHSLVTASEEKLPEGLFFNPSGTFNAHNHLSYIFL